MAKWTLIAATAYGLYKLTRRVIGEEKWNAIMNPKPKPIEEHPNSQQQPLYNPPPPSTSGLNQIKMAIQILL
jgi:hypothetical protein